MALAVVFFPLSLSQIDFRSGFSRGISVAAYKSSPAYAAFEDMSEPYMVSTVEFPEKLELLSSGQAVELKFVKRIAKQRQLSSKGMVVRAPAQVQPTPIYVAGEKVKATPINLSDYHDPQEYILALPTGQRAEVHQSQLSVSSVAQVAEELVEHELKAAPLINKKVITTQTGARVLIGGRLDRPPTVADIRRARDEKLPKEEQAADESMVSIASIQPRPTIQRPLWLNGTVEMTGGLAYVGPETQVVVKRMQAGETFERGRIWLTEGKFEIYVKKPEGFLVAELQTSDGRLLGRGEMNLNDLGDHPSHDNRVYNIRLALRPMSDGASFRTISGYSHDQQKMPVREARVEIQSFGAGQVVDDEGVASESSLDHSSTFVVRAQAKNHWPSLVIGQAERPQEIRLFSNSLVKALIGLGLSRSERGEALEAAVVWGKITRDGDPLSGAKAQMAGNYQPIYFNEMYLPDPTLKATSTNGLFAFLKVKPGVQALRVSGFGRIYPAQVFPTENKHISYLEVEVRDRVVSQFKVFDVLNMNREIDARVRLVGTDQSLGVSGNNFVEYSVAAEPFMVEAEAGAEYEISRITLSGQPQVANIPLVKRDWLYQLQMSENITSLPGRGIVLGFIDDVDFDVEMTGYGPRDLAQIVYFDSHGKVVKTRHGVAGGGFAIFNAPPGLQTVYVHPVQSREVHSQVVVAEPDYVHIVAWSAAMRR